MHRTAKIVLALGLALAATPTAHAYHPHQNCLPIEEYHGYFLFSGLYAGYTSTNGNIQSREEGIGYTSAADGCAQRDPATGLPGLYDGESEMGAAGGRFVAGTRPCVQAPEVAHHAYGVGARYWADDGTGFATLVYSAGADGPALVPDPTDPCATDGIITANPVTDPLDCGAGATGLYAPSLGWFPATLQENVPGSGACNPYDGAVWVFITPGVFTDVDRGSILVSTPLLGHIYN